MILALIQVSMDRAALVQGVDSLVAPGALPGAVIASKGTFVVLRSDDKPVFAAGRVGSGRAIVGGHEGFFSEGSLQSPGNSRFFTNALGWLGGRSVQKMRVGILGMSGTIGVAQRAGAETINVGAKEIADGLLGIDVLLMSQGALDTDPKAQQSVVTWLKRGHGLLTAGPAWGWQQLNPTKNIRTDHAANRMLMPFGLGFSGETAEGTPVPTGADDRLLQTESALGALRERGLTPAETARAAATVSRALSLSPLDDKGLVSEINRLAEAESSAAPLPMTGTMPFSRLRAVLDSRSWEETAPEKVRAHPSAALFPGPVPPTAKRITRRLNVDTKVPQWQGTGLYLAPGEVATVTLPTSAIGKGFGVRVGSHSDELWHHPKWDRFPSISRRWALGKGTTKIASPFGGTVFIDVPANSGIGVIEVTIAGAVPAPHFVRGTTTSAEWARMLAEPGGPWVEMEGRGIILSLPRSAVADLKDPEALMAFWDETMDLCYELYAAPRRSRQERYSVDRQISAGYMHAGYPIMTFEDVANTFADVSKLRGKGATWGFFHELGHNFQESSWSFPGTGEVTNNLFSLYGSEKLNGLSPADYGVAHRAMAKEAQAKRLAGYLEKGAKFEEWKNDPFLALTMYAQLREAFGWAPFTKAFSEYRRLNLRPRGEIAQHDAWMTQMSEATGRNLGPFFTAWGVPTSEAARAAITTLPAWMPGDWPKS